MRTVKVEIPILPPRELNPNWRGHWAARAATGKIYRNAAMLFALQASHCSRPAFSRAEVSITIVIPDRRHVRDTDNVLASIKPAMDGCIDAEIIKDDAPGNLSYAMPVSYEIDKDRAPLTVLEFKELRSVDA